MPATTTTTSRRSKIARTVSGFPRLATLLVVAAGMGVSPSVAWERDAANIAVSSAHGLPAPSAPLQDPLIPVLPGGVVGPGLDARNGSASEAESPEAAGRTAGEAMPGGQRTPLVPLPAETWEQVAESRAHLLGQEKSREVDDGRIQQRRIGIGIGLVGIIGILAVMAAVRGGKQRQMPPSPMSVFHTPYDGTRRP